MAGEAGDNTALAGNGAGSPSDPPMFRGVTALTLDAKGRLAIPTRHRDVLAPAGTGNLVLTADPSRCLLLYPRAAWELLAQGPSAARRSWHASEHNPFAEEADPAYRLALRGVAEPLDAEFEALAAAVFGPLREHLQEAAP